MSTGKALIREVMQKSIALRGSKLEDLIYPVEHELETKIGNKVRIISKLQEDQYHALIRKGKHKAMIEIKVSPRTPNQATIAIIRDDVQEAIVQRRIPTMKLERGNRTGEQKSRSWLGKIWIGYYVLTFLMGIIAIVLREILQMIGNLILAGSLTVLGIALIIHTYRKNQPELSEATEFEKECFQIVIQTITAQLHELNATRKCWSCFQPIDKDAEYCPYCGSKL